MRIIVLSFFYFLLINTVFAGEVLIDYNFQTALPAGITTDGTLSTGKNADGVCTKGAVELGIGKYLQVGVPSCGVFKLNMKSSGTAQRVLTVKYKRNGDDNFVVATTSLIVQTAATFILSDLFPDIIYNGNDTIRIECTSGGITQIHDLYVEASDEVSNLADILAFKIPGQVGEELINAADTSVTINVAQGVQLNSVTPHLITLSSFAAVSPSVFETVDFSGGKTVVYTVTAQDEVSIKSWKVRANEVLSSEKEIVKFKLSSFQVGAAEINPANGTISLIMPQSIDITNIIPELFEISPGATIAPLVTSAANFTNPVQYTVTAQDNSTKIWTVSVTVQPMKYKINATIKGIGKLEFSPAGDSYSDGTEVTVTAIPILGSTFSGWSGDVAGNELVKTIIVNADKNITATFLSDIQLDFNQCVGFASVTADNFTGPTTGGGTNGDTVYINGPSEFAKLCDILYKRIRYKYYSNRPLTIVLEEGVYDGTGGTGSVWGNSMLTIQEQADLTIIGRKNVTLKFGINVKRSWNIIIRNLHFQEYYDDGINIGEPETHHVWVDHCTIGHPTTMPANTEHPDGGIDVKNGASYVTISWCLYRNSWKTGLVGHSDNNGSVDLGRLKVTYYMNHFYNTNSRNPRVRFGEVHVLNNLHEHVMLYGIVSANTAQVFAENNFFLNTDWPMYADRAVADFQAVYGANTDGIFTSKTGNYPCVGLKQTGNEYDDSGLPVITAQINPAMLNPGGRSIKFDELNAAAVFDPRTYYNYDAIPASSVKVLAPLYAGADKVDFFKKENGTTLKPVASKNTPVLYPNPTSGMVWVANSDPGYKVYIFDLAGKLVYLADNPGFIDLKHFGIKPGTYIVQVKSSKYALSQKLIVK